MANTFVDYTGDNTTTSFAFSIPYLDDSHIVVQVDQASIPGGTFVTKTLTTDYTIQTSPSNAIIFNSAPATGDRIRIKRVSDSSTALVDFENGSVLTEVELDRAYLHNLYLNEEIAEGSGNNTMVKDSVTGNFNGDLARIANVADPVDPQDVTTKNFTEATYVNTAGDTMTGVLSMGTNKITNVVDPTTNTDAATKNYVDARGLQDFDGINTTSSVDLNGNKIINASDPVDSQDVSTKNYVDDTIATSFATGTPPPGNTIGTSNLDDDAVITSKIANDAVITSKIANDAVTYAKLQNVAANNVLLGNDNGAGSDAQELSATEVRTILNVADGATANDTDANLKNRANHTGTQLASTISDFDTEVANNTAVAANTAKVGLNGPVQNNAVMGPGTNDVVYGDASAFQNAGSGTLNSSIFGRAAGLCIDASSGSAIRNTAFGQSALGLINYTQPTPNAIDSNTAVGGLALVNCTGDYNTVVGASSAYSSGSAYAHTNTTVLGSFTTATGDNQVVLGDTNVTTLKCNVTTITSLSDERTKENIKDSNLGLEFINELKTKTFNKKNPADWEESILEERYQDKNSEEYKRPADNPATYTGLIAQEVKGVLDKLNIGEWDGWNEEPNGVQRLGYGALVMPLIKAVQELSAQVEDLKSKI